MAIQLPGAGKRRERRARSWDAIADNSGRLREIYATMIASFHHMPVPQYRQDRIIGRYQEVCLAEKRARDMATRVRSGLG